MKSIFQKLGSSKSKKNKTLKYVADSNEYKKEQGLVNSSGDTTMITNTQGRNGPHGSLIDDNIGGIRKTAPPMLPRRPMSSRIKIEELTRKRGGSGESPENMKNKVILEHLRRYLYYLRFRRYVRLKKFSKQQRRLYQVIETIETEKSYKFHLEFCVNKLQKPIIQNGLIPEKDVKKIFANMENLLTIATTLLTDMDLKKKNDPNLRISQCFLGTSHFFKLYKVYINNYDTADHHLRKFVKKSSALRKLMDDAVEDHPNHYKLSDFMILPVQRIPRYKLLLEGIIKLTPEGHHELEDLKKAAASVEDVAEFVNLARVEKMYGEVYEFLRKVINKKEDLIILDKPSRKFQEQGLCLLLATGFGVDEFQEHKIVLFNDCVIFVSTKKKKGSYIIIEFKLSNLKKVVYDDEEILILEGFKMGARQEIHMFFDDDQDEWFEKILDCIKESKVKVRTANSNQFSFTGYTPKPGGSIRDDIFE